MKNIVSGLLPVTVCALLACSLPARAIPVTVEEVGIGANHVVNITSSTLGGTFNVYAGVVKLKVDGIATDGFCIDPFHWSVSGPQNYTSEALDQAPKSPGGAMGINEATWIEKLWAKYYTSSITADTAAGLQIAIWDIIGAGATNGATFTLNGNDYGAATMVTGIKADTLTAPANLMAVTGPGQDYVITGTANGPTVPDGGATIMLLAGALSGLGFIRRKICLN